MVAYPNNRKSSETEKHEMKADVNNDGKVSYEEFKNLCTKHMDVHFKRRDTNSDGFIDVEEKKQQEHTKKVSVTIRKINDLYSQLIDKKATSSALLYYRICCIIILRQHDNAHVNKPRAK